MSRTAAKIELSAEEIEELNRRLKSGKTEQRKVERAKIVLQSAEGKPTHQIAKELGTTMNKPLPSNGTKLKSNNSPCAIISLTFASNY